MVIAKEQSQSYMDEYKKFQHSRFLRHTSILVWKSYLQRQRRWHYLLFETVFAGALFLGAIFIAKPIFLTPIQSEPTPPLTMADILATLPGGCILGYAPVHLAPVRKVMRTAAKLLKKKDVISGKTEDDLNNQLIKIANSQVLTRPVMWVIFKENNDTINRWKFSIRSTERARYKTSPDMTEYPNPHLRAGFLAVQVAISHAIVDRSQLRQAVERHHQIVYNMSMTNYKYLATVTGMTFSKPTKPTSTATTSGYESDRFESNKYEEILRNETGTVKKIPKYRLSLVSMPVSPLMQENRVRKALSIILLCFTVALIPPVLETEALVVSETANKFKRSLRIHSVDYSSMYLGWIIYAHLTAIPICFLAAITLILIFRWIHLVFAMMLISAYLSVMIMNALIMAMFHSKAWISCVWSTLFTLVLTYLAQLLVHHKYDAKHKAVTFLLHVFIPPLGLVNAFNSFALLQTGRGRATITSSQSLTLTIGSWAMLILIYFGVLMLMQRTVRSNAIGGRVSWKKIIFKKGEDVNQLHSVETPTGKERDNLQEVDEHVAKAISFRSVSKSIMGEQILRNITLDVYRGEFTMFFCERVQDKMIDTIEDLLTGLTFCDTGIIYVLGQKLVLEENFMNTPHMMGYCHWSKMLINDLTVEEHFILYFDLCLWQESRQYITEYGHIRTRRLLVECNLEAVRGERVKNLTIYYRAQLCWALALLLEPRIVIIPNIVEYSGYVAVIRDKIMNYRKHLTIVNICFTSIQLEYADRVFVFDSKIVAFGGTPAYMFFKYGRGYRVRLTLRNDGTEEATAELITRATSAGASVRAHYGSLLILRLPVAPTELVARLVLDLTQYNVKYNITSLNITVADSEEIYKRSIYETRTAIQATKDEIPINKEVLRKIIEPREWNLRSSVFTNMTDLRTIGWKVCTFHIHYRLFFVITMTSAIMAGIFLGMAFSTMLVKSERDKAAKKLLFGELMTVEAIDQETVIVLRARKVAKQHAFATAEAYVKSEPNVTKKQIKHMSYTVIPQSENIKEYLVTRAIDSPQMYVYLYAYGLDIDYNPYHLKVLYSPLHFDQGAAARSMAKAYTSLLRIHSRLDASIQVTDDPLALDLTPWMRYANRPPLLVQFLLILSVVHVTFLPSKEYGLIRHTQSHSRNFSPARYWLSLYFWDLLLFWILVFMMTGGMLIIMYFVAPKEHFYYQDLLVVPFMLIVYGAVCIPQAYLFSLGPRVALNAMTYLIVNLIFGETTVLAKIFYGDMYTFALLFMSLSPQYNMVYAIVKIKQIFLYNSECIIFNLRKLCSSKTLHKCCEKCGILQECFYRKTYLNPINGISTELIAMLITIFVYLALLFLIEYKVMKRIWKVIWSSISVKSNQPISAETPVSVGCTRERKDVTDKMEQILKAKKTEKMDTFGEYLLANDVTKTQAGFYTCYDVYLGLSKGEALALSGLKRHGRLDLCDILAGYDTPSDGIVWSMSKWRSDTEPHMFSRNISYNNGSDCLPPWMTVADALEMIALLRGVPRKYVREEVNNHIEVLELTEKADVLITRITSNERTRLNFAAAVIGAPPILVLDEFSAYQKFSIKRVMYDILYYLRKQGHAIIVSASDVESHMPVANKLAIILDGRIYDIDTIDNLVMRYSKEGYTVVVHLKEEVIIENMEKMFKRYFKKYFINDATEVLVNVQVFDSDLSWGKVFEKMETMKKECWKHVYSYIITTISIDYIYNRIINSERGNKPVTDFLRGFYSKSIDKRVAVSPETLAKLVPFEQKYDIITLKELPWSVIFHR